MRHTERGTFLIELALILPLLLFIVFLGFELASSFRSSQIMGPISREAGNIVSRSCIVLDLVDDECVADVVAQMNLFADQQLPGSEIMVGIYKYDSVTDSTALMSFHRDTVPGPFTSRYSLLNVANKVQSIKNDMTSIVTITEVFNRRERPTAYPLIDNLVPVDLYETAIF